ncbi:MAG: DUF2808 domain-containing protein [Cyanobacteria bacterium P01_A01_bin.17]
MNRIKQLKALGMGISLPLGAIAFGLPSAIAILSPSAAQSLQLADGTISFAKVPQLLKASTPHIGAAFRGADYYFTFRIPEDAGEPLQQLTFAQRKGVEQVDFLLGPTRAYPSRRRKQSIALAATTNAQQQTSVRFDEPILPGETITISLKAKRNPNLGGVYLFGVTAFPAGEKVQGQFLGYGRLHFFRAGGGGRG